MDIQEVERMEELIKKARGIAEKIEELKGYVNNANNDSSTIDIVKAEIERLEKELAELWVWS
ncbi:hypothetical protein [Brevibacillus laterosporus]|uniref:hypothetical protein n=1 Tax=Brevibacillus laterosporus TaxID=1465 RepID=UPI0018CCDA30|nr:hypothetical protein [Brevibacillus laterosporus]MBG9786914.1 hypothetical protein [Brevibacillus laterosporus]